MNARLTSIGRRNGRHNRLFILLLALLLPLLPVVPTAGAHAVSSPASDGTSRLAPAGPGSMAAGAPAAQGTPAAGRRIG
jgi:hypothetical protein